MVNNKLVILASLATLASTPTTGADGLHSSLSFPQCTSAELSSNSHDDETLEYEVLRKGKKIGTHRIMFNQTDRGLKVTAKTKMKVSILFVPVYKYEYVSEELWCGGELLSVETRVNDNGTRSTTALVNDGETYTAHAGGETYKLTDDFFTTNHWNPDVVQTDTLFNTITGELNEVTFEEAGEARLETKLGEKQVTRYSVDGQLTINTFYDRSGNWSGMAFEHKDGSPIEFRCIKCGAPKTLEAS